MPWIKVSVLVLIVGSISSPWGHRFTQHIGTWFLGSSNMVANAAGNETPQHGADGLSEWLLRLTGRPIPANDMPRASLSGTVIRVADGDTLQLRDDNGRVHRIRLHAVDAPELAQSHGKTSQTWLSNTVLNQNVTAVIIDEDSYKRKVAKILKQSPECQSSPCEPQEDINLQAIATGHAWWYRRFAPSQSAIDQTLYRDAEEAAKIHRLGLWQSGDAQAPWAWREQNRQAR